MLCIILDYMTLGANRSGAGTVHADRLDRNVAKLQWTFRFTHCVGKRKFVILILMAMA